MKNAAGFLALAFSKPKLHSLARQMAMIVAAVAVLPNFGHAAVVTSLSAVAPSGPEIMTSQAGFTGGLGWFNTGVGSVRNVGQSFLATSNFELDKITLELGGSFNSVTATSDFTLTLYSAADLSTSPAGATTVSTQAGTFAFTNGSGGSGTFLTFDLANVALTSGTYYTFMLSFDDPLASNSLTVRQNGSSTYSNGNRWLYDGTSYTSSTTSDLTFYVQSAVPEPSAAMLLMVALGMVGLIRRKRA